jgi:hypothetical protein
VTVTVTHAFTSGIADDPAASAAGEVLPSHWNAAHIVTGTRQTLTAATSYYVAITGNDSNDGSLTRPWLTLQHVINFFVNSIDIAGNVIQVNIGAGTFAGFGAKTFTGGGHIYFKGAGSALTTITAGPNDGVFNDGSIFSTFFPQNGTQISVNNFAMDCTTSVSGFGINSNADFSTFNLGDNAMVDAIDVKIIAASNVEVLNNVALAGSTAINGNGGAVNWVGAGNINCGWMFFANYNLSSQQGAMNFTGTPDSMDFGFIGFQTYTNFYWFVTSVTGTVAGGQAYYVTDGSDLKFINAFAFPTGFNSPIQIDYTSGVSVGVFPYTPQFFGQPIVGLPTAQSGSASPNGLYTSAWGVFKDTSGGGVYLAYNDAGTIKKVALT